MQTRYYDPELRRFINADNYDLIPILAQNIGELNLYSYCNNNPVMYTDESGESFLVMLIVGIAIGAVIGGVAGGIDAYQNGTSIVAGILCGAITGAAIGAAFPLGAGAFSAGVALTVGQAFGAMAISTFIAGAAAYRIDAAFNNKEWTQMGALQSGFKVFTEGAAMFA